MLCCCFVVASKVLRLFARSSVSLRPAAPFKWTFASSCGADNRPLLRSQKPLRATFSLAALSPALCKTRTTPTLISRGPFAPILAARRAKRSVLFFSWCQPLWHRCAASPQLGRSESAVGVYELLWAVCLWPDFWWSSNPPRSLLFLLGLSALNHQTCSFFFLHLK